MADTSRGRYQLFSHRMAWFLFILFLAQILAPETLPGANQSLNATGAAKLVYIAAESASIWSGPSKDYYPTSTVRRGDTLEAHHRTDDGWLAVRPPQGSMSWVPAQDAYLLPGGRVIEITSESAVSWIGTQLGTAKQYRWQVELSVGEQLTVLGESTMTGSEGRNTLWYKIAPPSGEYRWIHESDISETPITPSTTSTQAPSAGPPRIVSSNAKPLQPMTDSGSRRSNTESTRNATVETTTAVSVLEQNNDDSRAQFDMTKSSPDSSVEPAQYIDDVFHDETDIKAPTGRRLLSSHSLEPSTLTDPHRAEANHFAGWHAWELGEGGMRFNLLDRLLSRTSHAPAHDPLNHDPYDLSMTPGPSTETRFVPPPRIVPGPYRPVSPGPEYQVQEQTSSRVQDRPWRDPRTLRGNTRFNQSVTTNIPDDDNAREQVARNLVTSIRENVDAIGQSIRNSSLGFGQSATDRDSIRDEFQSSSTIEFEPDPIQPSDVGELTPPEINWYGVSRDRNTRSTATNLTPAKLPAIETGYTTAAVGPMNAGTSRPETGFATNNTELMQLQQAFNSMVAQPPAVWDLQPIIERTQHLIDNGSSPIERGQARLLLDRIRDFEGHARRTAFATTGVIAASYRPTASPNAYSADLQGHVIPAGYKQSERLPAVSGDDMGRQQHHDATGWLVPVHATDPGKPTHALTDDSGKILVYVTAAPGLKLDRYVNEPIGIIGLRGYLPQLQAGLIQAQRVITLR